MPKGKYPQFQTHSINVSRKTCRKKANRKENQVNTQKIYRVDRFFVAPLAECSEIHLTVARCGQAPNFVVPHVWRGVWAPDPCTQIQATALSTEGPKKRSNLSL